MLLSLGLGWTEPLQGLRNLKIYLSPILSMGLQVLHSACSHSQSGQCPGRLEARSEACSVSSLKPKQDYLISLTVTPWTVAHRAPLSMGFSRQEYWSGLPCPSPGDLPNSGIESGSPALQADSFLSEPPGKPFQFLKVKYILKLIKKILL